MIIVTMTSNLIFGIYAVFGYKVYEDTQSKIRKSLIQLGINPPALEMVIIYMYNQFKAIEPYLKAIAESGVSPEDLKKAMSSIKNIEIPRLKEVKTMKNRKKK